MQHTEDSDGDRALPFASCYEQPASSRHAPPGPTTAPAPSAAGVCIMRKAPDQPGPQLDCSILHQAGLKTRESHSCIPDFIITSPTLSAPLAIMMVTSTDPTLSLDSPAFMQRCASMASTFRVCAVALPHLLGCHPAVLQLACDARYKGIGQGIMLHYTCPGGNPAHTVLQMVSCCSSSPEALQLAADAWSTVVSAATAPEAVEPCLSALMSAITDAH